MDIIYNSFNTEISSNTTDYIIRGVVTSTSGDQNNSNDNLPQSKVSCYANPQDNISP